MHCIGLDCVCFEWHNMMCIVWFVFELKLVNKFALHVILDSWWRWLMYVWFLHWLVLCLELSWCSCYLMLHACYVGLASTSSISWWCKLDMFGMKFGNASLDMEVGMVWRFGHGVWKLEWSWRWWKWIRISLGLEVSLWSTIWPKDNSWQKVNYWSNLIFVCNFNSDSFVMYFFSIWRYFDFLNSWLASVTCSLNPISIAKRDSKEYLGYFGC